MDMKTDDTIVCGVKDNELIFIKSFNIETEREDTLKAYDYVRDNCDNFFISAIENYEHYFIKMLQNDNDKLYHECSLCNCRCNCNDQPCSCCND